MPRVHGNPSRMQSQFTHRRLGLPLGLQLLGILVGALIVAQLVTLVLTVLIPPAPVQRWDLEAVAANLLGKSEAATLERRRMAGPPDISGSGWLVSASSREALARRLDRPVGEVVLAFYTQLPVGGVTVPVEERRLSLGAAALPADDALALAWLVGTANAQAVPGGPPPSGRPPGGSFPGGGFPGGGVPGGRMPGVGRPGASPPVVNNPVGRTPASAPGPASAPVQIPRAPAGSTGMEGVPQGRPGQAPGGAPAAMQAPPAANRAPEGGSPPPAPPVTAPQTAGPAARLSQPATLPDIARRSPERAAANQPANVPARAEPMVGLPDPAQAQQQAAPVVSAAERPSPVSPAEASAASLAPPLGRPQPIPFRATGVLTLTTPPFIEGDFIAAMRQPDGSWIAVAPRAEPFPNRWQQRVMAWFALSLLIVAPLAWLFARRIVTPLESFARAAEALGRDPAATVLSLSGPAEIGRAARAFNLMQNRLRAFVDDRTAMVGAISHDLRTPLTRLRFRLEDIAEDQREPLLREVEEMELMISQVIAFIRDASTPGARERLDFARLVESSVEDVRVLGGRVDLEVAEHVAVEVDPIGMRRLLGNLLENALKYGESARVRVSLRNDNAVAEIIDDGPGIPVDEHEQAFEPFYRGVQARGSDKPGSGLGLAVCRSIARAHGGEVSLEQREEGFVASVTVPVSYNRALRIAA